MKYNSTYIQIVFYINKQMANQKQIQIYKEESIKVISENTDVQDCIKKRNIIFITI